MSRKRSRSHKFTDDKRVRGKAGRLYRFCTRCHRHKIGLVAKSRCARPVTVVEAA